MLRGVVDRLGDAVACQPGVGDGVFALGQGVEQVSVEFGDALFVEAAHHRQEAGLVRRDVEVGDAEQERVVAFVSAAVEQVRSLRVVRATMMPGTFMMSSWKRAALRRLICSSEGTRTLPP